MMKNLLLILCFFPMLALAQEEDQSKMCIRDRLNSMEILEDAMKLIPTVRLAAGLPPLVTPTSQIVGAQAVNCALDIKNGKPMYSNVSNQFVALVKGEYGKTPVPVDPEFRLKIAGTREEIPYDTSKYQMQENPVLTEFGGVKLAENEKEVLLICLLYTSRCV